MDEQAQPMRDTARDVLDEAKQQARQAKQQVEEGARDALRTVAETASERAGAAAGTIAHEGRVLANALRSAAEQAEHDGARVVHAPLRNVAEALDRWSERAEHEEPRHWLSSLQELGRREPWVIFGAATAAGFVATRALRAGVQARSAAQPHERRRDPRTDMTVSLQRESASAPPREATPLDTAPARLGSPMAAEGMTSMTDEGRSAEGER